MRDFNSYSSESGNKNSTNPMDLLKNLASKYEGASQSELISAIIKEAEKQRKNGSLSDSDIDNFVKTISPMLNGSQKEQLKRVVEKIKRS